MRQRNGEHLVGADRRVVPRLAVDYIEEAIQGRIPESLVKAFTRAVSIFPNPSGRWDISFLFEPGLEQAQRVVPKRIDLDRLSSPRSDNPISDLRIHPGQLITVLPLSK